MELLQSHESAEAVGNGDKNLCGEEREAGSREWARAFWRTARKVARRRLESMGSDLEPWESRLAQLHESLWVEELGTALELRKMRLTADALPCIGHGLFTLDVADLNDQFNPGLQENGLLRGVRLRIRCNAGGSYWALVQPGSSAVTLVLAAPAPLAGAQGPFSVEFHAQRFQQLAMHRALDSLRVEKIMRDTTPRADQASAPASAATAAHEAAQALPARLNESQRRAVAAVLEPGAQDPLTIWGPPGTGKSTLAAFIIWHLLQQRPTNLHVLAAAPSNTAADIICAKLARLGVDTRWMLRLNALGRSSATVPEPIRQFCSYSQDDEGRMAFSIPPLQQVRRFKVVVTTCVCAAHLSNALRSAGSQAGWFSHVVVDEAGEATEPETLVPLALLRPVAGRAVLLGDHFQLGPLVTAPLAAELGGLGTSMIERLANERLGAARAADAEERPSRDALLQCEDRGLFFLTESYRSHPAIMSLYSRIFYAGQLEHRPRPQHSGLLGFFESRGVRVPFILHNIVGVERQDAGSASMYNTEEVGVVQQYALDMLEEPSSGLEACDVGIITPYTRQVRALEAKIESLGPAFRGMECGTVEHFQGQERRAVILSAVRSSRSYSASAGADRARRPIGFLADPRRLNVALSRAVAGLVIIGDLQTLAKNSARWLRLVQMAQEADALRGEPLDLSSTGSKLPVAPRAVPVTESSAAWDALTR